MAAQNVSFPFYAIITTYFPRGWCTDSVKKFVTFSGEANTVFTFEAFEDVSFNLDGPVVVTFYLPSTIPNNPLVALLLI